MSKPRLVVLHRNMGLLGGAQRDLIVALPEHAKRWSITLATLNAPRLLLDRCEQLGIEVVKPDVPWQLPTGPIAEMTARAGRASHASALPRASSRDAMARRSSMSWPAWFRPAHCRLEPYAMPSMQPSVAMRRSERTSTLSMPSSSVFPSRGSAAEATRASATWRRAPR